MFVEYRLLWKKRSIWVLLKLSSLADEHNTSPKSTRRHVKSDKFIFGFPWLPGLLCNVDLRHQYGISVAESQTSPAATSKEKLACVAGVRKGRGRESRARDRSRRRRVPFLSPSRALTLPNSPFPFPFPFPFLFLRRLQKRMFSQAKTARHCEGLDSTLVTGNPDSGIQDFPFVESAMREIFCL